MSDHEPRLLLITGGSRGIGAALAKLAAEEGWTVALTYRSARDEAETVAAAIENSGGTASVHHCDTADQASIQALFDEIDGLGTPLRGLANNAGVINPAKPFIEKSADEIARLYAVNTVGATLVLQEAAKRMARSRGGKGGSIVTTSSIASRLGGAGASVEYSASKAAVDSLTFGLGTELAGEGIRVNAVRPGIIDTEIHADLGMPDRARKIANQLPMKRAGTADEVAKTILFLLSEDASYVSNALLDVSGGR
ncbi:SDR family oxidoreductase [Fulvimarina endophytica]|uniref:SDR family oxidoreductase n=1 Tax=Fulvimarina endophytica TaxID=2293836 RepID=A0A371X0R6_9HYPH|nr:SDR family oxidoreductase [Fulvimarina endophytica]RFC62838.1 SDR family oxidoreductase [Fulvimarina endophytica]